MSIQFDFAFFGGDLRQVYMAATLLEKGYRVAACGLDGDVLDYVTKDLIEERKKNYHRFDSLADCIHQSTYLIGPIPISRDKITINGNGLTDEFTLTSLMQSMTKNNYLIAASIPSSMVDHCITHSIPYYDLMKDEAITILNAIATAEGTIMEAIRNSPINLHGSQCLILGYGRCAKVLATKLKALDAQVTVAARSRDALAYASANGCKITDFTTLNTIISNYDFIINTVPSMVLDKPLLDSCNPNVLILDISSAPGGVDFQYADSLQRNAKLYLGLPGKYAPKTSSNILVDAILTLINERKK